MEELIALISRRRDNKKVPVEKGTKKGGGGPGKKSKGTKKGRGGASEPDLGEEEGKDGVPAPL